MASIHHDRDALRKMGEHVFSENAAVQRADRVCDGGNTTRVIDGAVAGFTGW